MFFLQTRTAPSLPGRAAKTATTMITGAASGIGRAFARALADRGHALLLVDRNVEGLHQLAEELRRSHEAQVDLLAADLARPNASRQLVHLCRRRRLRISTLINCAAINQNIGFARQKREQIRAIVDVNIVAILELTRLVLPAMIRRKRGTIVNITSIGGFEPMPGMAVYAATKAFLNSFTASLASELDGTGVYVTNVCPGLTRTPLLEAIDVRPEEMRQQCQTPEEVVEEALRGMGGRRQLIVTGFWNRLRIRSQQFSLRLVLQAVLRAARSLMGRR